MNHGEKHLNGYNLWFTIEVLSFYGYIISATLFIAETQLYSQIGLKKTNSEKAFKYDFIKYYRKDLDWFAFVFILFVVNLVLTLTDQAIMAQHSDSIHSKDKRLKVEDGLLKIPMYLCVVMHFLQVIFLRRFRDVDGRVIRDSTWVWYVHFIVYPYITFKYVEEVMNEKETDTESRRVWILMDILLMLGIGCFFYAHVSLQKPNAS